MQLRVNGKSIETDAPGSTPLLYVLRDEADCRSARYGCGAEQCGACTVLVDGVPTYSCTRTVDTAAQSEITTLEGLASPQGDPSPVQAAILKHNAAQCGYCLSGIVVAAHALFESLPTPSLDVIRTTLEPHLCRCGAHPRILRALAELAGAQAAGDPDE